MLKQYDDFDLEILKSGERYLVRLLNSPSGQASAEFGALFTQVELQNFYSRIGQGHRNMRRVDSPALAAAKLFGERLFEAVFTGQLLTQLRLSEEKSGKRNRGVRLRLRLTGVPELAELPWEFLYDKQQDHFIATSAATPVVRYMDLDQSVSPLRVRLPLRVLVMIASPSGLALLDAEGEWVRLKRALAALEANGTVLLERLPVATLDALRLRARGEPFHILHFIGHGGFDLVAQEGSIYFEDTKGIADPVPGRLVGNILRDHESLRLVILNACEGARQSNDDPFSGVAQSLCRQRLPAVIAMQFEISDDAAKMFAEEFYAAIAEGLPVDTAVAESRKALFHGRFGQEWATPVLYMRSSNGLLFQLAAKGRVSLKASVPGVKGGALQTGVSAEEDRAAAALARTLEADRAAAEEAAIAAEKAAADVRQRAEEEAAALLEEKKRQEREAKELARAAAQKAAVETAEKQAREKAELVAKEKVKREAKAKAERETKEKAEWEAWEQKRVAKDKAAKEFAAKFLKEKVEKEAKEKAKLEAWMEKQRVSRDKTGREATAWLLEKQRRQQLTAAQKNARAIRKQEMEDAILGVLSKGAAGSDFHVYPNIPERKLKNARTACRVSEDEKILGLIDITMFGSASDCVLFGMKAMYWRELSAPERAEYSNLSLSRGPLGGVVINGKGVSLNGSDVSRKTLVSVVNGILQHPAIVSPDARSAG